MNTDRGKEIFKAAIEKLVGEELQRATPPGQVASIHHILIDSKGQRVTVVVGFYPSKNPIVEEEILIDLAPEVRSRLAKDSRHKFVPEIILELDQSDKVQELLDQKLEN